jgi:hypothetical protein
MRTREQIEKYILEKPDGERGMGVILELLLDIRDLLALPRVIGPEVGYSTPVTPKCSKCGTDIMGSHAC